MEIKDAKKALEKIKYSPGESFKKRSPEDQKIIASATGALARAGLHYVKPSKTAKKADNGD